MKQVRYTIIAALKLSYKRNFFIFTKIIVRYCTTPFNRISVYLGFYLRIKMRITEFIGEKSKHKRHIYILGFILSLFLLFSS